MNRSTNIVIAVVAALLTSAATQGKDSDFCASRTTEAYHSPKCNWGFVVKDPHKIEGLTIPHKPPYHTYSRWALDSRRYVFAYRDIGGQPDDMVVDIYRAGNSRYALVGRARITGIVTNVSTARLTGNELPDVVFRFEGGQLQYVVIVRLFHNTAQEVFRYGASTIDIVSKPKPVIEARSRIANLVEQFAWDSQSSKFHKRGKEGDVLK